MLGEGRSDEIMTFVSPIGFVEKAPFEVSIVCDANYRILQLKQRPLTNNHHLPSCTYIDLAIAFGRSR